MSTETQPKEKLQEAEKKRKKVPDLDNNKKELRKNKK